MKTIIAAFVLFVIPFSAMAQSAPTTKEMAPPRGQPKYPEVGNLHNVDAVLFPHDTPMLKERQVVPESAVVPPDQGYQTPCQKGSIKRCSGVDLSTIGTIVQIQKSDKMLLRIVKPPVFKIQAVTSDEQPSARKLRTKRR